MKKYILTLLTLLVSTLTPIQAYEYFTIYFSDGTKSEAFYATDVDSICYSKLDLDSIAYDDWQVQEIYTCDSVYRYLLAQIDSLSFKDVDENQVAEDLNRASSTVVPLFSQCETLSELSQNLPTIRHVEGVKDAWIDGNTLSIDIRDYGTITFINPPAISSNHDMNYALALNRSMSLTTSQSSSNIGKVCIYNHMDKDEDEGFNDSRWVTKNLKEMYNSLGISCEVKTHLLPDFFVNQMFDYDQLFIITHGYYDKETGTHWLVTDEEILCIDNEQWFSHVDEFKDFLNKKAIYSSNKLKILPHSEIRNGKSCVVFYVAVSEHLISMSKHRFQNPNAIVFNAACQSMKGEENNKNNLAKAFINKGASCYIGYSDNNTQGRLGGFEFYQGILNGSCIESSYNLIEQLFKEENLYEYKSVSTGQASLFRTEQNEYLYELENEYHPVMRIIRSNPQYSALHVETIDVESNSSTNETIIIQGQMRKVNSDAIQAFTDYSLRPLKDKYQYGFQWSTNSDMSQPTSVTVEGNYDNSTLYMNWEKTLDTSTLKPNTTYYYRAYMYDGYSNSYGEIKQFNTGGSEAYYITYGDSIKYYYDEMYEQRKGISKGIIEKDYVLINHPTRLKKVIFDSSFSNYYPTRFSIEGSDCLEKIENLQYLKTDSIRDMSYMFYGCSSLTSLDLSSFDTSNVSNMYVMFSGCSSLTSLDLSSFDTSNVSDRLGMVRMFSGCSSLTSLDLSSFDTSNVTNMSYMFYGCNSLSNLNISNFNTEKTSTLECMFSGCSMLKVLDLSSFKFTKWVDVEEMFWKCTSLTTIYASSNWVSHGSRTFEDCKNLVGGKGTHIGENIYDDDKYGYPRSYFCGYSSNYARIDGGKDNPGLFTAK